jgi:nicotinamide-nucleotide amidase
VGLVHFAVARRGARILHEVRNFGDRGRGVVRYQSVMTALDLLERMALLAHG